LKLAFLQLIATLVKAVDRDRRADILDRGWGKPTQPVNGGKDDEKPIAITRFRIVPLLPVTDGNPSA
jgi:hypothetical protein